MKFQAVAEKTVKDATGYFILSHPVYCPGCPAETSWRTLLSITFEKSSAYTMMKSLVSSRDAMDRRRWINAAVVDFDADGCKANWSENDSEGGGVDNAGYMKSLSSILDCAGVTDIGRKSDGMHGDTRNCILCAQHSVNVSSRLVSYFLTYVDLCLTFWLNTAYLEPKFDVFEPLSVKIRQGV